MMLSYDKNGNIYQNIPERGTTRVPEMVMDSHLALGEYEEKKLKDLEKLKRIEAEKAQERAKLNMKMALRRREYTKQKAKNAYQRKQNQNRIKTTDNYLKSELLEEAVKQPPMGFDYSPTIGNPLIGFGAQGEIILDPQLTGESIGEVYESENFGNTTLTAALLPESYMMDETMGIDLNPFHAFSSVAKATINIGGKIYDWGSDAARTALRAVDSKITGGKIADIVDDANATVKNIRETTAERIDDITKNAELTSKGILNAAVVEARGITHGDLTSGISLLGKTAFDTVERTYEDSKEAWFDTKEALEETGTGRLLLKSSAEVMQKTDPGWQLSQGVKLPLIEDVYKGVDPYTGGLLSRAVSGVSMPGKLIRGNAGLQLTDERVSKAEFIQNMVFYAQVAMTVLTFGAASAAIIIIAEGMKKGPLGATKEGQIIFSVIELGAMASSGGATSLSAAISNAAKKEAHRELAEKASEKTAKKLGMGGTGQEILQAALMSGNYRDAGVASGRILAKNTVIAEASKKTGTTGGLLTSMALEATWATAGAPNENEKGEVPTKSEVFHQSMKQQVIAESQKRAIGMSATQAKERIGGEAGSVMAIGAEEVISSSTDKGDFSDSLKERLKSRAAQETIVKSKVIVKEKVTEQAYKTLPKSQVDMLVNAGEIGYSAYESDEGFSNSLQSTLKEKTYDKALIMVDKKEQELIKQQRKKVDEVTNKVVEAKQNALAMTETSSQEIQEKAQQEAEKQALQAQQKAIDEVAEIENQIYDLQVVRDHVLEQAELAPQQIQDQLTENAKALEVKITSLPDVVKTKAERELAAAEIQAQRAMEMVERNKERVEQFNATAELGEAIAKLGEEARALREKALNLPPMDAEELLKQAIALEMQMIEMYMQLQMMENRAAQMTYEASVYDARAGIEYAAAQEGRYPAGSGKYDYDSRHPMIVYGYFNKKVVPFQPTIEEIKEAHA